MSTHSTVTNRRPGSPAPTTRRTRDGDFQLAKTGDLNLATCGYFLTATDRGLTRRSLLSSLSPTLACPWLSPGAFRPHDRVLLPPLNTGPGGLTVELVRRSGAHQVAAVDPTPPFVEACRSRNPGADIRQAAAESLPFADGEFDAALASLVVVFMKEPTAGLREMARVTAPGGIVAACFWHHERMPGPRPLLAGRKLAGPVDRR